MHRFIITLILSMVCLNQADAGSLLYERLDSVIATRAQFTQAKADHIAKVKHKLSYSTDSLQRLFILNEIYNEYRYFRFDSAVAYAKRGMLEARRLGNVTFTQLFTIHEASILSASGLYSEAERMLQTINLNSLNDEIKYEYYLTLYWLYTYWSDYCIDNEYRTEYWIRKKECLLKAIEYCSHKHNDRCYLLGEKELYVAGNHRNALNHYLLVLKSEPENTRLFSAAAFAAACCYEHLGDIAKYEELMVSCAITDICVPVKENMSLQTLAEFLFKNGIDIERAERYINVAIDDAEFFGNRLRILNSTAQLRTILDEYKGKMKQRNVSLSWSLIGAAVLMLLLIATSVLIALQKKQLARRKEEIGQHNSQLETLNAQLSRLNDQLSENNAHLLSTNAKRENLAKIYIDLCSQFIDRLENYQKLVMRKIKAKQTNDLLMSGTSIRLSDEETAAYFTHFDRAFLDLFPGFVEGFNDLLTEDNKVHPAPGCLTPELRIFALIRLGVKESSEIANLLFYTPRTIYNYRSSMKSRARCKETFEDDVRRISQ